MTAVAEDELQARRARIRQRELLLALERWAPEHRNAGETLSYVFEITSATEEERHWVRRQVAKDGLPSAPRTAEDLREQGRRANAAAGAAFLAGDYAAARDLIDDALAHGALYEGEWTKLHHFIASRTADETARPEAA
jgi:hypothetical protein